MSAKLKNAIYHLNRSNKSYLKNFSWMMVEHALKIIFGLSVSIYLVRYLGPSDYGLLSYALSLTGIVSPFATLGIDAILLREVIKDIKNERNLLYTAQLLKLGAGLTLTVVIISSLYILKKDAILIIIVAILMLGIILDALNVYKEYIVAVNKMRFLAFAGISSLVIANLLKLGLLIVGALVVWFAFAIFFSKLVNVLSLRYLYKKNSLEKNAKFSLRIARDMLKDSWPLIFTSFTGIIFMYADQLIIEYYYGYESVGIYAASVRLLLFFMVIPSVISNMIYPAVIKLFDNNSKNYFIARMEIIYFYHFVGALILICMFSFLGDQIVSFLYGESYVGAGLILRTYSFTFVFVFFNPMNNKLLMIENLQKLMLLRNFIGLVFNLGLNLILVPKTGMVGASIATVLSQAAIMASYYFDVRTKYIFRIQVRSLLYPTTLVSKVAK